MNKTIKIQIIKPIDMTWGQFGEILYSLQKETREIMNKTIQFCWEWQGFSSDYKEKHRAYPKDKDFLISKKGESISLSGYINTRLNENYILYSSNNSQSQQRAMKKWKSDSKQIFTGEKSIANYKRDLPLDLHNKSISITYNKSSSSYYCDLKLLNRKGVETHKLDNSSVKVLLSVNDNSQKQIINRIISGEYKIGGSQIVKHKSKSKWFVNLSYSFEPKSKQIDKDNILGVDMGLACPVYLAINNSFNREYINGGEIEHFRKKTEARRRSIQQQGKYCGDGRIGHGTKTRINPLNVISNDIKNFRDTCNHKYSRFVVGFAIRNNCGIIQMEDLSGISDGEKKATFLGGWSYYDLQQKIKYKAEENGIEVRFVKANYTSKRCNKCGFIHKDVEKSLWRPKQDTFKCINCDHGHKHFVHADYNAAQNIAMEGIEKIIEDQLELQDRIHKNGLKYLAE